MIMKDAIIPDTNVFIHDPNLVENLKKENFFIYLPWIVILELDKLKSRSDVGINAREALRNIEKFLQEKNKNDYLIIFKNPSFRDLDGLDKNYPDYQVIATANTVSKQYGKYHKSIKIISQDRVLRILANELGIRAEDYVVEQAEVVGQAKVKNGEELKTIKIKRKEIEGDTILFNESHFKDGDIVENEGVVCCSYYDPFSQTQSRWKKYFAAIRKGDSLLLVPNDISLLGIKPYSLNSNGYNWHQHIAMSQLCNSDINLVFLLGETGSGKTILSLASAIAQRKKFLQIIVVTKSTSSEDEGVGFVPDTINEKMNFLKQQNLRNKKIIKQMVKKGKLTFLPLDHMWDTSFYKKLVIVDDAQNLTLHQIKSIITQSSEGTKLIFTGNLQQIDRKRKLDQKSSGLTYAVKTMENHPLVAVITLQETLRSSLASLAKEVL